MSGFKLPKTFNPKRAEELVTALENRLEETKVYVGTKQIDYEYKHKSCADEIREIDDYVNSLYNLTEEESSYIKNIENFFGYKCARRYRLQCSVQGH